MLLYIVGLFSLFDLTFMSPLTAHFRDQQSNSEVTQYESALQSAASSGFARFAAHFTLALAVIVSLAAASLPAAADEAPAEFIRILGEQALAVMRSNAPAAQKEAYFHQMLHQDFDLDGISRFVLGPYWRVASAEQRQQFRSRLENYIMRSDGARLAQYGGGQLDVTGSRTDPAGVIVTSQVIRLGGRSIEMDWQLAMSGLFYKIEDVTIDGVSMALTHRFEIASMIARNGGRLEALLATMRQES